MKKIYYFVGIVVSSLALASCDGYLDKTPDNRIDVDTQKEITGLLVSAYPSKNYQMMAEFASDNVDDNGSKYSAYNRFHTEAWEWRDVKENDDDGEQDFWDASYSAIAHANLALESIDKLGNPAELNPQRGEALLCRAYNHFMLSYIFCNAWTEAGKDKDLGIPYMKETEKTVSPSYTRGTIGSVYEEIEKDIEAGLPLISDDAYSVPKYHFNKRAAYAFAARFYLYYGKYDRAIECANQVLGSNPASVLRDWQAYGKLSTNYEVQPNEYCNADNKANLLMFVPYSGWAFWGGPYSANKKYTHNATLASTETCSSTGVWGKGSSVIYHKPFSNPQIVKVIMRKVGYYFEYTDVAVGIGYTRTIVNAFNTDATLLDRAEAYALKGDFAKAIADMQVFENNYTSSKVVLSEDVINNFYDNIEYYTAEKPTIKKELNPTFVLPKGADNLVQLILYARRILTLDEGWRWGDIKRYGIEVRHRIVENNTVQVVDSLMKDDPRRAMQLPADVISAGLKANPRNK